MGVKSESERFCYTAVCVGCRWGDAFALPANGDVTSALEEARRRHEQHRREHRCLFEETVYVVDGITDPTVEEVGRALMQPFLNIGATRIVEMIADALGLRPVRSAERRPTITKIQLVVAQGLVPDGIFGGVGSREAVVEEEELVLVGAGA